MDQFLPNGNNILNIWDSRFCPENVTQVFQESRFCPENVTHGFYDLRIHMS